MDQVKLLLHMLPSTCEQNSFTFQIRKYIRQRLPFNMLSDIFKRFLPSDPWTHPCSHPVYGNACKIHQECFTPITWHRAVHFIWNKDDNIHRSSAEKYLNHFKSLPPILRFVHFCNHQKWLLYQNLG